MKLKSPFDKWLASPGKGLHHDIFVTSCFMLREGWSQEETFDILRKAADLVEDRYVPDREICDAITDANRLLAGGFARGVEWPQYDHAFRAEILRLYVLNKQALRSRIPAAIPPLTYLRDLYGENDLVCIGRTAYEFRTVRLCDIPEDNRDLSCCEFINPSPMSNVAGLTEDGQWSEHAKSNTGPRVYGVIEFDYGTPFEHAAILRYLATKLPLVMIVFSGNASLHGWFSTSHATEEMVEKFYQEAVLLGADPKMFSPCQFSRLPMGTHGTTGRTQHVIYFNRERVYHK